MTLEEAREEIAYLRSELGLIENTTRLAACIKTLDLQPCAAKALLALYDVKGRVLGQFDILDRLDSEGGSRTADVLIYNIRKRLGAQAIETHRGLGYSLTETGRRAVERIAPCPAQPKPPASTAETARSISSATTSRL